MKRFGSLSLILVLVLAVVLVGCGTTITGNSNPGPDGSLEAEDLETGQDEGSIAQDEALVDDQGQSADNGSKAENSAVAEPGQNPETSQGADKEAGNGETGGGAKKLTCTYSINCSTIFDNLDKINPAVLDLQPKDGWIFSPSSEEFLEGESVFDILVRITRREKIHMEFNSNPALNSKYVEGINNLYEFDAGELSGWTYKVNGLGMGYGSSSSYPRFGDIIEWVYTCDQGRDVGYEP